MRVTPDALRIFGAIMELSALLSSDQLVVKPGARCTSTSDQPSDARLDANMRVTGAPDVIFQGDIHLPGVRLCLFARQNEWQIVQADNPG